MIPIGQQVKIIRILQNIKQEELAVLAGVDRRYLSQFENGHTMLKDEELERIGSVFKEKGVSPVLTICLSDKLSIAA